MLHVSCVTFHVSLDACYLSPVINANTNANNLCHSLLMDLGHNQQQHLDFSEEEEEEKNSFRFGIAATTALVERFSVSRIQYCRSPDFPIPTSPTKKMWIGSIFALLFGWSLFATLG